MLRHSPIYTPTPCHKSSAGPNLAITFDAQQCLPFCPPDGYSARGNLSVQNIPTTRICPCLGCSLTATRKTHRCARCSLQLTCRRGAGPGAGRGMVEASRSRGRAPTVTALQMASGQCGHDGIVASSTGDDARARRWPQAITNRKPSSSAPPASHYIGIAGPQTMHHHQRRTGRQSHSRARSLRARTPQPGDPPATLDNRVCARRRHAPSPVPVWLRRLAGATWG